MKKYSSRIISIFLSLILIVSSLPLSLISVNAQSESKKSYYLAPGASMNGTTVVFSLVDNLDYSSCEYTFSGSSTSDSATGTFQSETKDGKTVYLSISGTAYCPNSATETKITVAKSGASIDSTFSIKNAKNSYLYFNPTQFRFDRNGAEVTNAGYTSFVILVKDETSTDFAIPGYKRVTSVDEITDGSKYLIAAAGSYDSDGSASSGYEWFFLKPSVNSSSNSYAYEHIARLCETNKSYNTMAYCARGTGMTNNTVTFPVQGFTSLKHCEFTFNGSVSGDTASGNLMSKSLGYVNYLSLATVGIPVAEAEDSLQIKANTLGALNTFTIYSTDSQKYLHFWDDESTAAKRYYFDRGGVSGTQTAFALFVRDEDNKTSGIYGYKRVTSLDEIKNGEKYIIAHPSRYNYDGTAKSDADWYVVYPSHVVTNYIYVAKIYNTMDVSRAKRLLNGSFEYASDTSLLDVGNYTQMPIDGVHSWLSTAVENKIELFTKDVDYHMAQNKRIPDGKYAAELNAAEPSSLYQVVNTIPSSTYLWGLDHRGRWGNDTMALVIGPNQEVRPTKNSGTSDSTAGGNTDSTARKTYGKDQFMQMVEWAKTQGGIQLLSDYSDSSGNYGRATVKTSLQNITVYSKPFDVNGGFETTDDLSPFSLVPTDEHTEEWHIWIMISGSNDWSSYGANSSQINGGNSIVNDYGNIYSSTVNSDELKKYFYSVPAGQKQSIFAFVPIDTADQHRSTTSNGTSGNLLDNINFDVYNQFTASSTDHGTGAVSSTEGVNDIFEGDDDISKTNPIYIYTRDDSTQNLVAKIKAKDVEDDVSFAGVYLTVQDEDGNSETVFKPRKDFEIEESKLTWTDTDTDNVQKATATMPDGRTVELTRTLNTEKGTYTYDLPTDIWLKRVNDDGDVAYIYQLKNVSYAMDAHFIFLKSPTVTYDENSDGKHPYQISEDNTSNVYSFKPNDDSGTLEYIDPVTSHAPDAPNENWKFVGWKIFNDNGALIDGNDEELILSATNAIACNTKTVDGVTERTFVVVDGMTAEDAFGDGKDVVDDTGAVVGKEWTTDESNITYRGESDALTLIAQWRFKNSFIPVYQDNINQGNTNDDSEFKFGVKGGTVELSAVSSDSDNYAEEENGKKTYFAEPEEQVVATAKAENYYTFVGWYDGNGNVITTNAELLINQVKGDSHNYYARFQRTGVAVNFYYLEYNEAAKMYEYKVYDGGKYTQYLNKGDTAEKPTDDSKKVKSWFTSPTKMGADTVFDFNDPVNKSIDLYAIPSFTFNYFNQFQFAEPWRMITYATLKYDGKYIDMKSDADVTDYKVYILKGSAVDEAQPTSTDIKNNEKTLVVSKNNSNLMYNAITNTGNSFNRIGTKYNNLYIFNMKTPVWVTFDFTYRGITFTANVKNRSLYNNIDTYMKTTGQQYYTEYGEEQEAVLTAIQAMYKATAKYNITEATEYKSSASVSSDVKADVKTPEDGYTFSSSTAIRNIEPWGFKYSFSVNGKALSDYEDYGAVVLTGADSAPTNAKELVNNENAVMYSKSGNNIYSVDGDANTAVAYHVNGITIANYDKDTYAVFFVKDSSGYHYSAVVTNSYKSIASADTSDKSKAVSAAILDYAEKYRAYVDAINSKNN